MECNNDNPRSRSRADDVAATALGRAPTDGDLLSNGPAKPRGKRRKTGWIVGGCIFLVLAALGLVRIRRQADAANRYAEHRVAAHGLFGKGQFKQAAWHFQQMVALEPELSEGHYGLGTAFTNLRDANAIDFYREAIRLRPDYGLAYGNLGVELMRVGRLPEAIGALAKALEVGGQTAAGHSNLGQAMGMSHDFEGAMREYRLAIKIDPNNVGAQYNLGTLLLTLKQAPAALPHLKCAVALAPNNSSARMNLAIAMLSAGDEAGAQAQLELLVRLDPRDAQAREALAALRASRTPASQAATKP